MGGIYVQLYRGGGDQVANLGRSALSDFLVQDVQFRASKPGHASAAHEIRGAEQACPTGGVFNQARPLEHIDASFRIGEWPLKNKPKPSAGYVTTDVQSVGDDLPRLRGDNLYPDGPVDPVLHGQHGLRAVSNGEPIRRRRELSVLHRRD